MGTTTLPRSLARDDRGAVLVLGIFMCSILAGAIWYLAGVGDAMVYRERLQEASDAASFSSAALHARALNLLVLLNLLMALILAIRVAMKILQIVCLVLGAIFLALSLIPFAGAIFGTAAQACFQAANQLQNLIQSTREPINRAIEALSKVQVGIARGAPAAAMAGSVMVGSRYQPVVTQAVGMPNLRRVTRGLQVEESTEDKLCEKAGEGVVAILEMLFDKVGLGVAGRLLGRIRGAVGDIVRGGAAYFCEIGSGGPPPNMDGMLRSGAEETCDGERDGLHRQYSEEFARWNQACAAETPPVGCGQDPFNQDRFIVEPAQSTPPDVTARLRNQAGTVQGYYRQWRDWDRDECMRRTQDRMRNEIGNNGGLPTNNGNNGGSGGRQMTPKRLIQQGEDEFFNGCNAAQILGWGFPDSGFRDRFLNFAPRLVRVASLTHRDSAKAMERRPEFDVSLGNWGIPDAWTQAEYFYDCADAWRQCNREEEAMWHFRWRPRIRRYNRPWNDAGVVTDGQNLRYRAYVGQRFAQTRFNGLTIQNSLLRVELGRAAASTGVGIDVH